MDKSKAVWIYRTMTDIRNFENKVAELFAANKLHGSVHLCTGQEAIAAGVCSQLNETDYITITHRGHGHCIAKGTDVKYLMAELAGKDTGVCRGRGGSIHVGDFLKGNLGSNGTVGGGLPIALGAGFSAKYRKTDQVAVAFFGDGGANQGVVHESMNLAALWKLPVIFICENNGYAISTPFHESSSVKKISVRARAYNMPGCTIDGNDVNEIIHTVQDAIKRSRAGEGPSLIECLTYRWAGHWNGDPTNYRTKDEVNGWKNRCPIKRYREWLIGKNIITEAECGQIDKESENMIEAAVSFAMESPEPGIESALNDVFHVC